MTITSQSAKLPDCGLPQRLSADWAQGSSFQACSRQLQIGSRRESLVRRSWVASASGDSKMQVVAGLPVQVLDTAR